MAEEGIECDFRRVSNYTYAESDDALARVRDEAALAARLGLPSTFTSDVPLPFAVRGAVRFDHQAQFHAVRYLQGLARAVDGSGCHVFEDSRVTAVRDGTPGVVETGRGTLRAREVIVAANFPIGDTGVFAERCYLHRSYIVASQAHSVRLDGTFISVDEPMRSILAIDVDGSSYVLTGGEGHRATETGDAAVRYRRLEAFARERLGAGETSFRWSTQDVMPLDGLPYVGTLSPTAAHLHVITGLRKWGLTNGTAGALMLADTLSGRHNPWAAVFDTNRTSAGRPGQRGAVATGASERRNMNRNKRCKENKKSKENNRYPRQPAARRRHCRGDRRPQDRRVCRRRRRPPRRVGHLHASGLHGRVQRGRRDVGLPLPWLAVCRWTAPSSRARRQRTSSRGLHPPVRPGPRPAKLRNSADSSPEPAATVGTARRSRSNSTTSRPNE